VYKEREKYRTLKKFKIENKTTTTTTPPLTLCYLQSCKEEEK